MYSTIKQFRPYFHSLREIKNNISLDVKLPKQWVYEEIVREYKISCKIQDEGTEVTLISFIGAATEDGYETVFSCVLKVIRINKELEEKNRLYKQKIKELEQIFKSSPLDKLKNIKFETDDYDEKITFDMVEKTTEEGPTRDRESQTENDSGSDETEQRDDV